MIDVPVVNADGKAVERMTLPSETFEQPVHGASVWQAVRMYLANRRLGLAKTKTRGEVSGGGRKPWRQKHTGRARQGSIRSPQWKGGGKVFGPRPRDYGYALPEKVRRKALISSVTAKLQDGDLLVVDRCELAEPKTKRLVAQLNQIGVDGRSCLLVMERMDSNLKRAAANLGHVQLARPEQLNAYDVLRQEKLVFTKAALEQFIARVQSQGGAG